MLKRKVTKKKKNPSFIRKRRNPEDKRVKARVLIEEIKAFLKIIENQENPNLSELTRIRDTLDATTYLDRLF